MLSYQHIYHAGNFADVQKHALIAALLKLLVQKPLPFHYIDTHAGRGLYDLSAAEAEKTAEFRNGIALFAEETAPPLAGYLALARDLTAYPGSAKIAQALLRPGDRLTLVERHPGEFAELQKNFAGAAHVALLQEDGFAYLTDKLPPPERRGLVLVDPSYEIKSEYDELPRHLQKAVKRWPQGMFMVWYPMLAAGGHKKMLTALRRTDIKDMLVSEIVLDRPVDTAWAGMYGTGVVFINPPAGFEASARAITQAVAARLPTAAGAVYWLNNRKIDPDTGFVEGAA